MREPENVQDVIAAYNERKRAAVVRAARAKTIEECAGIARLAAAKSRLLYGSAHVALKIADDIEALKDTP